jgi:lipoprotein-anchoring transpeptidase ErfK/SrfK
VADRARIGGFVSPLARSARAHRRAAKLPRWSAFVGACLVALSGASAAEQGTRHRRVAAPAVVAPSKPASPVASPEARLIKIYRRIGAGETREAVALAAGLVRDEPNFRLAHLVYADLLTARRTGLPAFGAGAAQAMPGAGTGRLEELRAEAALRLQALRETPPAGAVPRQFLTLPETTRHAIAVDASRSRLYLLEHDRQGMKLVASYYVSLGRLGLDKRTEGDQRTPLGVYFVTSKLNATQLKDFYGVGALPLNYPNEYDRREGRTGGGIWLHGVARDAYAREPRATDGCVVLANEDLQSLLRGVEVRRTPVVIAQRLDWVSPNALDAPRRDAMDLLAAWQIARSAGDGQGLDRFYTPEATKTALPASPRGGARAPAVKPALAALKELSVLAWNDGRDVLVMTFGEVPAGARTGRVLRQYWAREGSHWVIFYEGVVG